MASIVSDCPRAETAPKTSTSWADSLGFLELGEVQPVEEVHFLCSIFMIRGKPQLGCQNRRFLAPTLVIDPQRVFSGFREAVFMVQIKLPIDEPVVRQPVPLIYREKG